MSADKAPKRDPKERAELFVATYQANYSEALTHARTAAETTGTAGWQENYTRQMTAHRESVANAIRSITGACDLIKTHDTSEEIEKDVKDGVKALIEERIQHQAWRNRTVSPYKTAAENCEHLLTKTLREAENTERAAPLVDRGLAGEVREMVDLWPHVKWNDDAGTVEIIDA